jgi:hypothetical protein
MSNSTRSIETPSASRGALAASALAGLIVCAAGFSACAVQPSNTAQNIVAGGLAHELADRDQALSSMQTPAVMEYSGPGGHFKAREQMIVRRPASLRVEAMSPLGVALVVAADGGQIAVFDPGKNTLMRGPATAETLERFARIPMAPQQAVRLLLALAPDSAMLTMPPSSQTDDASMKVLTYARADGAIDELGFTDDQLTLVREKSSSGRITYEVHYSDYKDIGAIKFPYAVEASFPLSGTTLKLRYERPIVDGEIDDALFVLSPGASTKVIDLGLNAGDPAGLPRG